MASLNVDWSKGIHKSGSYNIVVTIEPYKRFKLFQKIKFRDRDGLPLVNFSITNNSRKIRYVYNSKNHLSLDHIEYVDVFVCRCSKNNPVVIGVNHAGTQKYYGVSKLSKGTDLHRLRGRNNISDDDLRDFLIQENDTINKTITFRLDKKNRYNNIKVTEVVSPGGFIKYTHEPNRGFSTHKSILLKERTRISLRDNPINGQALGAATISVYFRQSGKDTNVPLMLEINRNGKNHYFSRKNLHETTWKKTEIDSDSEISDRLEQIEKELFHSILVLLHKKVPYKKNHLEHVKNSKPAKIIKGENINVTSNDCSTFNKNNYIRFEHDLSSYHDTKENYHSFGSFSIRIVFAYIFNVPIETYNENEVDHIYYQGGISKLSVWFFKCNPDIESFPLIINYEKSWFKPKSREEYFTKWVKMTKVKSLSKLCQSDHDDILQELKCVNRMLNQIELGHKVDEKNTCEYGIPRPYDLDESYDTNTINLQCGPCKIDDFYLECTHRPKNGFSIGKTCYKEKTSGDYSKNHDQQTERSCYLDIEANSAKEYYFKYDTDKEHPLLVEYELNDEKYNYYILQFDDFKFVEYKTKILSSENKIDEENLITILNHQNFVLNNVINIELDKRTSYSCCNELKHKNYVSFVCIDGVLDKCCNLTNETVNVSERVQLVKLSPENRLRPSYGYIGYKHGLESYILSSVKEEKANKLSNIIKIKGFKIGDHELTLLESGLVKGNIINAQNIYVYFYGSDPRPLLLCHDNQTFTPFDKDYYFKKWVYDITVEKCDLTETGDDEKEPLLYALTEVVGFLNEVDLSKYPTGTNGKGDCNIGTPSDGKTCAAATTGNTCTYVVHTYAKKPVMVSVKCSPVPRLPSNGTDGPTGTNGSCYKKLIHVPIGTNGDGARADPGFRLGDVVYKNKTQGSINYYKENGPVANGGNLSDHWRQPLVKVEAYFYNQDKNYKDPLLVVLYFKNGKGGANDKECYMLKTRSDDNMSWTKDPSAGEKVEKPDDLVKHLDCIRYNLKKILKVDITCQNGTYPAMWRDANANGGFQKLNGVTKNITVDVCENGVCTQLNSAGYKCFQHQIQNALTGIHDQVAGLVFTIPGENGDKVIQLYEARYVELIQKSKLYYNTCKGDVYVYFYSNGRDGTDSVPLMLLFNDKWYKPENREEYFTTWVTVSGLGGVTKPCGNGKPEQLATQLDIVNMELNRIELDPDKASTAKEAGTGTSSGYGLPETVGASGKSVKVDKGSFKTERVALTKQQGPKQPPQPAYYKVVHRTVNGFQIGEIKYNGKDFVTHGVKINGTGGTAEICVKQNGSPPANDHKSLVDTHKWNTVVAYYSIDDNDFKLPQLIVILKTNDVGDTVTSVKDTGYGYYILSAKPGGSADGAADGGADSVKYEYTWRKVESTEITNPQKQVTLNDATDFSLLNSVVILLDQKCNGEQGKYEEDQIGNAVRTAIENQPNISSPGQNNEINRITNKPISVTTDKSGACLQQYGYKLCKHDFSKLVDINESLKEKLSGVTMIAGLRFMIPNDAGGKYKQITLKDNGGSGQNYLYYQNSKTVYVFFYDQDPRPLMLCFAGNAYTPKDMLYYFMRWVQDTQLGGCDCKGTGGCCDQLVKALVRVSNFLNPVKLYETGRNYVIQNFNGQTIRIQVDKKPAKDKFCYHRYIHTPSPGFRLGNIKYDTDCIKESNSGTNGCITSQLVNESSPLDKYKSADKVVVFYYKHDYEHNYPMVVAMGTTGGNGKTMCNLYYVLVDKVNKLYQKQEAKEEFDLDDDKKLGDEIDKALFSNSNKLQIILDRRSMEKLYCKNSKGVNESGDFDQPYLCYTLAGTFSSLLIIGISTLLICKHFMKFKMKDMIPRF